MIRDDISGLRHVCMNADYEGLREIADEVERVFGYGVTFLSAAPKGRMATLCIQPGHPLASGAFDYARELYGAATQGRSFFEAAKR